MKIINIDGHDVIIDLDYFDYLSNFDWYIAICNGVPYASSKKDMRRMHIVIAEYSGIFVKGKVIDHINRNSLDNRRSNLRVLTQHQNTMRKGPSKNNTSGYRGVSFDKKTGMWSSKLRYNYETINFGRFLTKEEAALAYNTGAKKYFGEFAVLNVIPDGASK